MKAYAFQSAGNSPYKLLPFFGAINFIIAINLRPGPEGRPTKPEGERLALDALSLELESGRVTI